MTGRGRGGYPRRAGYPAHPPLCWGTTSPRAQRPTRWVGLGSGWDRRRKRRDGETCVREHAHRGGVWGKGDLVGCRLTWWRGMWPTALRRARARSADLHLTARTTDLLTELVFSCERTASFSFRRAAARLHPHTRTLTPRCEDKALPLDEHDLDRCEARRKLCQLHRGDRDHELSNPALAAPAPQVYADRTPLGPPHIEIGRAHV